MTNIASAASLAPAATQLPVWWYFDSDLFALEKRLLFDIGPSYVGHVLMVPNPADYHTLEWADNAHAAHTRGKFQRDVVEFSSPSHCLRRST